MLCDPWEAQVAGEKEAGYSRSTKRYEISVPEPHYSPLSSLLDRTPVMEFFGQGDGREGDQGVIFPA